MPICSPSPWGSREGLTVFSGACPRQPLPPVPPSPPTHTLTTSHLAHFPGARQDAHPVAWVAPPCYLQLSCSHLRTGWELAVGAVGSHRLDIWVPLCLFRIPWVSWVPLDLP